MNNYSTYKKNILNRFCEIFASFFFLAFGIGSIYSNPADTFNQRCSFVSILVGFILLLYGIFYKVTISDLKLNFICLIPFRKISLIDVERLKIETTKKGVLLILEYTNGKKVKLPNLNSLNLLDKFTQELENSIYQKKLENKVILDTESNKIKFNILLMFVFYFFIIIFSLVFAAVVSYFFIRLIKDMQIIKNIILLKLCVIFIFSITVLLFFKVFFFLLEKIKTK